MPVRQSGSSRESLYPFFVLFYTDNPPIPFTIGKYDVPKSGAMVYITHSPAGNGLRRRWGQGASG